MRELLVLSPHRDDAAFSLFICLKNWCTLPIRIKVSNFFTATSYAPHLSGGNWGMVSAARKREDHHALSRICRSIRVVDHGLFDAPLRLGIPVSAAFHQDVHAVSTAQEDLGKFIRVGGGVSCIAPLALGNHIDHQLVSSAAIASVLPNRLAFYEDLPYATWTEERAVRQRVSEIAEATGVRLGPFIVRMPWGAACKLRLISKYRSQITAREARNIASWANNYGGGERIWVPQHSRYWPAIG
jgi:hypothetical protein